MHKIFHPAARLTKAPRNTSGDFFDLGEFNSPEVGGSDAVVLPLANASVAASEKITEKPVSYTHLTLPTILRV